MNQSKEETPQSEFLVLSFEELNEVAVTLSASSPERVRLNHQAAGEVKSVEKMIDFLSLPFEQLMRVQVRMATLVTNEKEDEKKETEDLKSEGSLLQANLSTVFSKQSQQLLAVSLPDVQSVAKEIQEDSNTSINSTTTLLPPPVITPPLVIPVVHPIIIRVPQLLAVTGSLSGKVEVFVINNDGTFTTSATLMTDPAEGLPYGGAIGDFNADGILDLAFCHYNFGLIDIFLGRGAGTFFDQATTVLTSGGSEATAVATADFNGDGILDLVATSLNPGTLSIFLGIGDGTFGTPTVLLADRINSRGIILEDFNQDGFVDIALLVGAEGGEAGGVGGEGNGEVSIFLGSGSGSFTFLNTFSTGGSEAYDCVQGDFNGDGIVDLAVANIGTGDIAILLGIGNGSFEAPILVGGFVQPTFVQTGDFNKDGILDLAVGDIASNTVSILLGTSTGSFVPFKTYVVESPATGSVAHFNADGNLDLAVTSNGTTILTIFYGDEEGNFEKVATYPVEFDPNHITLGFVPAGISGNPINLALKGMVPKECLSTVLVHNLPDGWFLNEGTPHGPGAWIVKTYDVEGLTITSPTDFVGAKAFSMQMSWEDLEGGVHMYIINNVEMYAPSNPIFALPAGDNLTGSCQADMFVISHCTGTCEDTIFKFDPIQDKINLMDFPDIHQFSDLVMTQALEQNVIIHLDSGKHTILLEGVTSDALSESNFSFNEVPYTLNVGLIEISERAVMPFKGILENNGTIHVNGLLVLEGDLLGQGNVIVGPLGALAVKGHIEQSVIFENEFQAFVSPPTDHFFPVMTLLTFENYLETMLTA